MRETGAGRGRSGVVARVGDIGGQRRVLSGRVSLRIALVLWIFGSLALAACRGTTTQPTLPGGTYRSDTFHFSVTYPAGWQVNIAPAATASQGIPLHIAITRTSTLQSTNALISNCSILVLNTHDSNIAIQINLLRERIAGKDARLHAVSLGGRPGYQEQPVRQEIPGTQVSDTHTNYYLLLSDYVYEISTDAISSDNVDALLQSMVASFTIEK